MNENSMDIEQTNNNSDDLDRIENATSSSSNQLGDGPLNQSNFPFFKNVPISNESSSPSKRNKFSLQKLWAFTGPGLLISVAYLDPGNLESDLQAGAIAGYKLLWVLMYSTLAGYLIQLLSVRLGSATGFHLAEICYREYGLLMRYFLWIMIEIAVIASDIQQVIGSALALSILSKGFIPLWVAILITASDVFLFLLFENRGIRLIEGIFALIIAIMGGSFLYMYVRVQPDQLAVIEGVFYPWCKNCSYQEINQLVGIVGSIVMPHNIYFHSSLVLTRSFDRKSEYAIKEANKYYAIESGVALLISFVLNLFVTSVSAKSFNGTAEAANITLFNAGTFIEEQYGFTTKILWAIGLFAAGQCSTITGTYAGQFIMEGFTKINLSRWKRAIITRSISIIPCILVTMLAINSLAHLNFWCNIIKAIQLPFALLPLLHFTSSKRIMGSFRNNFIFKLVTYVISMCILGINIYFLINIIIETKKLWSYIFVSILVVYLVFVIIFLLGVNNVYRIQLVFRRIFSPYNADELDELIRVQPAYRRPEPQQYRPRPQQQRQPFNVPDYLLDPSYSSTFSNSHQNTIQSLSNSNTNNKANALSYLKNGINKGLNKLSSKRNALNDHPINSTQNAYANHSPTIA